MGGDMTASDLLAELSRRGVTLTAVGSRLRYHPRSAVTPELLAELRQHKPALLESLREVESENTETETSSNSAENRGFGSVVDPQWLKAYVAVYGCYPPQGVGGPGFTKQWIAEQERTGWPVLKEADDIVPWEQLAKPVGPGYLGDPRSPSSR